MSVGQNVVNLISPSQIKDPIDVIVPTHGRVDLTMGCMAALYDNTTVPLHLIVVDDSDDLTSDYINGLKAEGKDITLIHSDKPYTSGNQIFNLGLAETKHEFVATVMNSVTVEPDWEFVALQLMKDNPKIGIVGFKCLYPWGFIESAGIEMREYTFLDLGKNLPGHRLATVYGCLAVQWAFALLRRNVIPKLEENIYHGFKGWDDIDNCLVVKNKGYEVFYCGLGVGYHIPGATRGSFEVESHKLNRENAVTFYKRWGLWDEISKDRERVIDLARFIGYKKPTTKKRRKKRR